MKWRLVSAGFCMGPAIRTECADGKELQSSAYGLVPSTKKCLVGMGTPGGGFRDLKGFEEVIA